MTSPMVIVSISKQTGSEIEKKNILHNSLNFKTAKNDYLKSQTTLLCVCTSLLCNCMIKSGRSTCQPYRKSVGSKWRTNPCHVLESSSHQSEIAVLVVMRGYGNKRMHLRCSQSVFFTYIYKQSTQNCSFTQHHKLPSIFVRLFLFYSFTVQILYLDLRLYFFKKKENTSKQKKEQHMQSANSGCHAKFDSK